jgi:hypothetical protein
MALMTLLALLPVSAAAQAVIAGTVRNAYAPPTATAPGVFMQPQTVATPLLVRFAAEVTF